jgi:import inner membrane translocase subunit TIM44
MIKKESAASASIASEKIKQTAEAVKNVTNKLGESVSETIKGAAETEFIKGSKEKVLFYINTFFTCFVI